MKRLILFIILATGLTAGAQEINGFKTYWKNGLHFESTDKNFKIKLGGRIHYDVLFIQQDDSLDAHFRAKNGSELRRARLYTSGTIYKNIKFKFQVDFAPGRVVLKDVYIQLTKIPVAGNIRIGHFKEPYGLEMLTSSNFASFMERPLTNQFDFDRSLGIMLYNHYFKKRFAWYAGYFVPDHNLGIYRGNKYHITFRLTGLPIYQTEGQYRILHLGAGYSYQYHDNKEIIYKTRPEAHLAPKYINLQVDHLKTSNSFKGEVAFVLGSFCFESEYTTSGLNPSSDSELQKDNYLLDAWFANISWFITGEHKNYNPSKSAFDRVHPKKNFGDNGIGSFEIALRYSSIDFDDADLNGGRMNDFTAGLNWYLNPAVRFTFNYIHSTLKEIGEANIFQTRFQVTF